MDYTKPLTEIKQNFEKLTLPDQLEEVNWLFNKAKQGNTALREIAYELALIYFTKKTDYEISLQHREN